MQIIEFSEKPSDKHLFQKMLYVSCQYQSSYCAAYSKKLFSKWQANPNNSSPLNSSPRGYRDVLECSMVASGGQEAFDFFFAKYQLPDENDNGRDILKSMACAREPDVIQQLLQKTLESNSSGGFRKKDGWHVITYIIDTPLSYGRTALLPFLSKNFDVVVNEIGNGHSAVISGFLYDLARFFVLQSNELR